MRCLLLTVAVLLSTAGCGCAASPGAHPGQGTPAPPLPPHGPPPSRALLSGPADVGAGTPSPGVDATAFDLWSRVWDLRTLWLDCVALAREATAVAGSADLIATGTLTIAADGSASWSPDPTDRLRAVTPEGEHECAFTRLHGSFAGSVDAFYREPHHAELRAVAADGSMDLAFVSVRAAGEHDVWVEGSYEWGGLLFDVDLAFSGTETSDATDGGSFSDTFDIAVGTLRSPEARLSIDETRGHQRHIDAADGAVVEGRQRELDDVVLTPGGEHRLADAFSSTRTVDGYADLDSWHVSGELLRDGVPIGSLVLVRAPHRVSVALDAPARTFVLESHPLR